MKLETRYLVSYIVLIRYQAFLFEESALGITGKEALGYVLKCDASLRANDDPGTIVHTVFPFARSGLNTKSGGKIINMGMGPNNDHGFFSEAGSTKDPPGKRTKLLLRKRLANWQAKSLRGRNEGFHAAPAAARFGARCKQGHRRSKLRDERVRSKKIDQGLSALLAFLRQMYRIASWLFGMAEDNNLLRLRIRARDSRRNDKQNQAFHTVLLHCPTKLHNRGLRQMGGTI